MLVNSALSLVLPRMVLPVLLLPAPVFPIRTMRRSSWSTQPSGNIHKQTFQTRCYAFCLDRIFTYRFVRHDNIRTSLGPLVHFKNITYGLVKQRQYTLCLGALNCWSEKVCTQTCKTRQYTFCLGPLIRLEKRPYADMSNKRYALCLGPLVRPKRFT